VAFALRHTGAAAAGAGAAPKAAADSTRHARVGVPMKSSGRALRRQERRVTSLPAAAVAGWCDMFAGLGLDLGAALDFLKVPVLSRRISMTGAGA
jgi:hypothetical protein